MFVFLSIFDENINTDKTMKDQPAKGVVYQSPSPHCRTSNERVDISFQQKSCSLETTSRLSRIPIPQHRTTFTDPGIRRPTPPTVDFTIMPPNPYSPQMTATHVLAPRVVDAVLPNHLSSRASSSKASHRNNKNAIIGGVIAEKTTWRWLFYLNFPFCGIGLLMVPFAGFRLYSSTYDGSPEGYSCRFGTVSRDHLQGAKEPS